MAARGFVDPELVGVHDPELNKAGLVDAAWTTVSSAGGDVTVALSGISATCAAGLLGVAITLGITGATATASVGTVTPSLAVPVMAVSAAVSVGTVTPSRTVAVTGVSATASAGTVAPSCTVALSGVQASASVGTLTPSSAKSLAGVSATGTAGTLVPSDTITDSYAVDNFNRADQSPIAGNWTCEVLPAPPLPAAWGQSELSGNKVWGLGANSNPVYWNTTIGADCYVQAKAYGLPWPGVFARLQPGEGTAYFYMWQDATHAFIYRFVGSSDFVAILTLDMSANSLADGDTLRLEIDGVGATVHLRCYKNGTQIGSVDDTAANRIVLPGKVGVHTDGVHAAGLDDFETGPIPARPIGVSATATPGSLTPSVTIALTGVSATATPGSVTASGGAGGNVTVALTGVSATCSVGALAPGTAVPATGAAATGTAGSVTPATAIAASGVSAAAAPGTLSPSVAVPASGVSATGSVGTLAPSSAPALTGVTATSSVGTATASTTLALSGLQATSSAGTLAPKTTVGTTGVSATGTVGTVTPSGGDGGNVTVALTGVSATGSPGSLTPSAALALTGTTATGSAGSVTGGQPLTGVSATGSVGSVTPNITIALTGVSATGTAGTVAPTSTKPISGVSASGSAGSTTPTTNVPLIGTSATGGAGTPAPSTSRALTGTTATTSAGSVASGQPVTGVSASGSAGTLGVNVTVALTGVSATGSAGSISVAPTSAYVRAVLATGAVGYWRFDDPQAPDGTFPLSDVIGGDNGLITNTLGGPTVQQAGALINDPDTSAWWNSPSANVRPFVVPDAPQLHRTTDVAVAIWFKVPSGTTGSVRGLVRFTGQASSALAMKFNGTQLTAAFLVGGSFMSAGVNEFGGAPLDTWHFMVGVYDGAAVKLYLDGVVVASTPASGTLDLGTAGFIAGGTVNAFSSSTFSGYLDELSIGPALTAAQIAHLYQVGLDVFPARITVLNASVLTPQLLNAFVSVPAILDTITVSYAAAVVADGAIAYYRLDEAGATMVDRIAGNNGAASASVVKQQAGGTIDGDTSAAFDAVYPVSRVVIPSSAALNAVNGSLAVSMEALVYLGPTTEGATTKSYVVMTPTNQLVPLSAFWIAAADSASGVGFWAFQLDVNTPAGGVSVSTYSDAVYPFTNLRPGLTQGRWYHVVGTYDGTVATIYVNGVAIRSVSGGAPSTVNFGTTGVLLGAYFNNGQGSGSDFVGRIDEAAIYATALPAGQVATHYTLASADLTIRTSLVRTPSLINESVES